MWGGVKATVVTGTNGANGPVGTLPSGISNLQYEDYSLFVGTKNITISWSGSADGYLVYYLAEEGEPSWYQQRVYWYTKNYAYSEVGYNSSSGNTEMIDYFRRIVHLDQGPTAKEGNTYSTFYDNSPSQEDLSTDPAVSDMGIGWVPSLNPFLVGRSVKWDDPTCWDNDESKPVIKRVPLSQGSLTIENVSKSTIVFFTFQDAAGNYYAGPDKLTNSQAAANRHSPLSLLPWNECYISAHLNVPMPLKILWSTEENGTYTEVPAGTDVVFPTTAWVKFEWNTDFISAVQSSNYNDFLSAGTDNYDIYYTTTSLLPLKQRPYTQQFDPDYEGTETYDTDRLEAVKYESPFQLTANTVLRFAIYPKNSNTMYLGQDDNGGNINDVLDGTGENLQNSGNKSLKEYEINKYYHDYGVDTSSAVGLYGADEDNDQGVKLGAIPPINTFLRNNYLWGITFVKQASTKKAVTFSRPIPYTSWSENVGGRYGLGTGTYSYQTWVSDGDYLVPSSLEGICDFFIVVQPETYWDQSVGVRDNGIYMSRINWIPKNMPVIVRYRNYSTPKSLPSSVLTTIDNNNAAAEAELANGLYFHGGGNCYNYADDQGSNSFDYAHYNSKVLKSVYSGDYDANSYSGLPEYLVYSPNYSEPRTWQYDENGCYPNSTPTFRWKDPLTNDQNQPLYIYTEPNGNGGYYVRYKLYDKTDNSSGEEISNSEDYLPLYFVWDDENNVPCTQKTSDGNELLYHKVDATGRKLYRIYYAEYEGTPLYYKYDAGGNTVYQEVDANGNRLYLRDGAVSDGNGNYQKMDSNGELLYYLWQYQGSWVQLYNVYGEDAQDNVTTAASNIPSTSVDNVVSSISNNPKYTKVYAAPAEGTQSYLQSLNSNLPDGETIPYYPVWTTEVQVTTVPNANPILTTANTDYPAFTTEDTGTRAISDVPTDDYIETTTVTNFPAETTYRDNKSDYEYEDGYVYTKCDPLIDETYTSGDEPHAYTLTDTGHPAYITDQVQGSSNLYYGDGSGYSDNNYYRNWLSARMWKTTEASHEDDSSGETVYHVPLYDPYSGAEVKVWDFGGSYFTNIRELSNTMLTGSSSANYDFNFEDHTFYLYAGDPTHCQYNKDWMMYHLSTRQNRDEANFINVLQFSDTPITVDGSATYYGFSIDHKNEFHPANSSAWATEYSDAYTGNNVYIDSSKDYIFSAGDDQGSGSGALNVSLQSYSFKQRYNTICESTDNNGSPVYYQPVVDNWLVFAPNGGDSNTELSSRTSYYTMPYYYGYGPTDLMRKQTTIGSGEMDTPYDEVSDIYKESDSFGGWTSAAWKRVSSGTIAARRPYLQLYNDATFYDPEKVPDRNGSLNQENSAKYSITAGGGLSLREAYIEDDGTTTGLKHQPATTATADGAVYDLQGRRIADNPSALSSGSIAKGVYIVNGKKQVVR